MNNPFVSPEWELPISSGEYEIKGIIGEGIAFYDAERSAFLPTPGVIGIVGWRYAMPDEADIAEFRARIGYCYPGEVGTPHPSPAATPSPRGEG